MKRRLCMDLSAPESMSISDADLSGLSAVDELDIQLDESDLAFSSGTSLTL